MNKIQLDNMLRLAYSKVPKIIKYGPRYYFTYIKTKLMLRNSDYWNDQDKLLYKNKNLTKLLKYANKNVPYYTKLFNSINFDPNNFDEDDFKRIPFLTKDIIRENHQDLVSKQYNINKLNKIKTGGTTGIPMLLYKDKSYNSAREDAFVEHIYKRIGYKGQGRKVVLRDNGFVNKVVDIEKKRFWRFHPGKKELWFSVRHLTPENIDLYIDKMNSYNPDWIIGYPHAIFMVCQRILKNEANKLNIKGILFMSENLYASQLSLIKKTFPNSKTVSIYGHTERGVIAGTCENSMNYHIQYQYGHVEFLSNNSYNEVITTGYNNYAMPLIRYKTSDLVLIGNNKCSCKRNLEVITEIEGRLQCALYGKNGKFISDNSLDFPDALPHIFDKITQYQFYQDKVGECVMRILTTDGFDEEYKSELSNYISNQFDNEILVDVEIVEKIEKTSRGKHRIVISNFLNDNHIIDRGN